MCLVLKRHLLHELDAGVPDDLGAVVLNVEAEDNTFPAHITST